MPTKTGTAPFCITDTLPKVDTADPFDKILSIILSRRFHSSNALIDIDAAYPRVFSHHGREVPFALEP